MNTTASSVGWVHSLLFVAASFLVLCAADATAGGRPPLPADRPTLFVVGDSTANNGADLGWGSHLASFFDTAKINVANRAIAGRSSRSYITENQWTNVLNEMKKGDFVIIQWGHNDGGDINNTNGRPSLPGLGDESQVIARNNETVHTYGWNLRKYIADTRAKGATPIITTCTVRNNWRNGTVERGPGDMSVSARAVAASEKTLLLDHTNIIAANYEKAGQQAVVPYFNPDRTHTTSIGAELNAKLAVSGLKALEGNPVGAYLSDKGKEVEPYKAEPTTRPATPAATPAAAN